ncbi:MAG: response regulator, partial [Spirochaetales bacterium]|nr:response regulator [Spirochaetales bacterium]
MNYKLLIADDEPLVLVGLKSMLNWSELDISVEGLAHNGEELMSMIETVNPDIVITDIKMPVKTGLEVMEECRERYGRLPLFIILTSHEEYSFVKQAISCQAVNYLIKLELNQEVLKETVTEAVGLLRNLKNPEPAGHYAGAGSVMNQLKDRFFVRLLNGLFESQDRFQQQKKDLGIDDRADEYSVCYCEIVSQDMADHEQTVSLYSNVISLVCEAVRQDGYVVS